MKKPKLGEVVIYFPAASDRESRENGATENAAIVSQVLENNEVNLRIFNHATNGDNVPLRPFIKHKDDVDGVRPYWVHQDELEEDADETNLSSVVTSSNEEGVGPTTGSGSVNEGSETAAQNSDEGDGAKQPTIEEKKVAGEPVTDVKEGSEATGLDQPKSEIPAAATESQEVAGNTTNALPNDTEKSLANGEANAAPAGGSDPNASQAEASIGSQLDSQNNAENQQNPQGSETGDLQQ